MESSDTVEEPRGFDASFLSELQLGIQELADRYGSPSAGLDMAFLVYLRKLARFGFFTFGPISIDVNIIEEIVDATAERGDVRQYDRSYSDDFVHFSHVLMDEARRSGRRRLDELHFLLAFMRVGGGLPGRVFGELGVTPEQVQAYAATRQTGIDPLPRLYSPEEAAEYLGVHVQTVRTWIRSGRLPASRLAGQRALRIKASDLASVLEPIQPGDFD